MKRIEFIAPVEAMRGNLSGTQKDLEYPTNDNAAYESPVGSRNYARNYQPIFVGAKRASDGLKYFAVRTKTAVGMTTTSKKQMAVLGGAGAVIAAILRNKTAQLYTDVLAAYEYAKSRNSAIGTFRKFVSDQVLANLRGKQPAAFISAKNASTMVTVNNPYHSTGYSPSALVAPIRNESLIKFFSELADNAIQFQIEKKVCNARSGQQFSQIAGQAYVGVNLIVVPVQGVRYIAMGTADEPIFLQLNDSYVVETDVVVSGAMYTTTMVEPEI